MTLKDAALQAERDTAQANREQRDAERAKHLTELLDSWDGKYGRGRIGYGADDPALPMPERDAFTWHGYPGFPYAGYGRGTTVYGWAWETDGITFLYDATYSGQGLCVILTCPDCGERHADHPHGMDGLGKLLRLGRSPQHVCHEIATRNLAHAVRQAAEQTGMQPWAIAQEAADRDEAQPRR
jgi:hypothetical protein